MNYKGHVHKSLYSFIHLDRKNLSAEPFPIHPEHKQDKKNIKKIKISPCV